MSEEIELLRSIDASLKALLGASKTQPVASVAKVASDADLDGKFGDPEIKAKDPRDWTGAPMLGKRFSECPAEYLELLAERFDYFVGKNAAGTEGEQKKARYQKLDAARARGWAARIRAGKVKPADPAAVQAWADEESVSF